MTPLKNIFLVCSLSLISTLSFAQERIVGNDVDAHGCRPSAGYTWSVIKNECIRTFDEPIQLAEVKSKGTYQASATVIFSADKKKAEIFVVEERNSVVLIRSGKAGNYIWKKGAWSLSDKGGYKLKKGKVLVYKSK